MLRHGMQRLGSLNRAQRVASNALLMSTTNRRGSTALSVVSSKPMYGQVASNLESTQISSDVAKHDLVFPFQIKGNEAQIIEVSLAQGEGVRAEVGSLVYMDDGVEMETSTGGGIMKSFKRWVTGDTFFICDFKNNDAEEKTVVFGPAHPTKLVPVLLAEHGNELICQKGAFLCGARTTEIELYTTQNFTTGFFGGEGFILQRLTGEGLVILKGGGALICRELVAGQVLRVSGGNLVAFESSVNFSVDMVKGAKNVVFGGEGLFLTRLEGPGKVWLQGMPFSKLAESIGKRVGGRGGGGMVFPVGGGGGSGGGGEEEAAVDGAGLIGRKFAKLCWLKEKKIDDGSGIDANNGDAPLEKPAGKEGGGWFSTLFGDDEEEEE